MSETCINPAEIQDGDLMAYIDGTASEETARHVRNCRFCTQQVEKLARFQLSLASSLYRHSCPAAEQLVAFRHRELQGNEHLVVAQHLRRCPHCARELADLVQQERARPREWLRTAIEVVEAVLVIPRVEAAGVRGAHGRSRLRPQVYRAEEIEIIVNQHASRSQPQHQDLVGLIHIAGQVPATIAEATVELYHDGGLIALEQVSARGQFTFAALQPGEYDLGLLWESREVRLRGIKVR